MRKRSRCAAQSRFEGTIDSRAAEAVGGDEHRVPAAGPAECRRRALHVGAALGWPRHSRPASPRAPACEKPAAHRGAPTSMSSGSTPPNAGSGIGYVPSIASAGASTACAIAPAPTLPATPLPLR